MKNALTFITILGVCLSAAPAHAQFQVTVGEGAAAQVFKPVHGEEGVAIDFETQIVAAGGVKFNASGHVTQMLTGQKAISGLDLRFTRLTIKNAGDVPATSSIVVQSDVFKPIGPPFFARVHLDGNYKASAKIQNSSVSLSGSVLQPVPVQAIGTVTSQL
jgi:hypothetical protein